MALGRVSTYTMFSNTLGNVSRVQKDLFELQDQISSGIKANEFRELSGQVEHFTQLESKVQRAQMYENNNAINIARLETTNIALSQIIDIADEMENIMALRRNEAFADNISFDEIMSSHIESLAVELNQTFEGRFIFGGTRTDVNPVIVDPQVPEPVVQGTPDANYYQGSTEDFTMRADDNVEMTINVRADNEAFQKLFSAAYLALEGHSTNDDELLVQAVDMVQEGMKDAIAIQASVNADTLAIRGISDRQESMRLYWQGVAEEISKTDLLAASTKLAVDQATLQASFQAFSVVNSLRLVDFL